MSRRTERPLRVGLTGGIASGKSTVAAVLSLLGAPVLLADDLARDLMRNDPALRAELIDLLGPSVYRSNGDLDRSWLGSRIFADKALLEAVNTLVHPTVRRATADWHRDLATQYKRSKSPAYSVYESALLFETGAHTDFDLVVLVHAPLQMRIERLLSRDAGRMDRTQAERRAANQWTDEQRLTQPAWIILNDHTHALLPQVWHLHRTLIAPFGHVEEILAKAPRGGRTS